MGWVGLQCPPINQHPFHPIDYTNLELVSLQPIVWCVQQKWSKPLWVFCKWKMDAQGTLKHTYFTFFLLENFGNWICLSEIFCPINDGFSLFCNYMLFWICDFDCMDLLSKFSNVYSYVMLITLFDWLLTGMNTHL